MNNTLENIEKLKTPLDLLHAEKDLKPFNFYDEVIETTSLFELFEFQDEIIEELKNTDIECQNYFNKFYLSKNKPIPYNVYNAQILLRNLDDKFLRKYIYGKIIEEKRNLNQEKLDLILNSLTKKEIARKKKFLLNKLKLEKNKIKKNNFHKSLCDIKNSDIEDYQYFFKKSEKSGVKNIEKKYIFKCFFEYIKDKMHINVIYNENDLLNSSFSLKLFDRTILVNIYDNNNAHYAGEYCSENDEISLLFEDDPNSDLIYISDFSIFAHEFGHAVERYFDGKIEKYNTEIISLFFELLIFNNDFLILLNLKEKEFEYLEYENNTCNLIEIFTALRLIKNKPNLKIKNDEFSIYQVYLDANFIDNFYFIEEHPYLPIDEYIIARYDSNKISYKDCII